MSEYKRLRFTRFCDDPELTCCRAEKELERLAIENDNLKRQLAEFAELAKAKADGRLIELPCEVKKLENMLAEYEKPRSDGAETYTTGYTNGYMNGRAELLRYILQKSDGMVCKDETGLKIGGKNQRELTKKRCDTCQ